MANTQTTVPLFVANQVLTAAQQNTSAGTGVPVFATTVTRDAAFGGSNKALAEGQLCYIEASNVVQYYDGAAWATVGPATAGAVTLVETLSPSAASTAQFTTNSISSTYSYYTIFYKLDKTFSVNLRSGGSTITGANYAGQAVGATTVSATVNSVVSAQTSWALFDSTAPSTISNTLSFFNYAGSASQFPTLVQNPNFQHWSGANYATLSCNWQYGATQAVDSLLFTSLSGTFSGTIKLYGWS